MCQSKEQGGHRCASHLRPLYQSAVNNVFKYSRKVKDIDNLLAVATEYALTSEGENKIRSDIHRNSNHHDLSVTLNKALTKAKDIREAEFETEALIRKAQGLPPLNKGIQRLDSGVVPEPLSWSSIEPIWPNMETTNNALAWFKGRKSELDYLKKAYRQVYQNEWKKLFFSTGVELPPQDNNQGWQWRRKATESTNKKIAGARIIQVQEAKPGMILFNGREIKRLKKVTLLDNKINWATARDIDKVRAIRFEYDGDNIQEQPVYSILVELPNG